MNAIANIAAQLTNDAAVPATKSKKAASKAKAAAKKPAVAVAINPIALVESLGLDPYGSINRAITGVGMYISESDQPLAAANRIIEGFVPGKREETLLDADIMAKCLVEYVMKNAATIEQYDSAAAYEYSMSKMGRLKEKMPEITVQPDATEQPAVTPSGRANKNNNQKKAAALEIYTEMTRPDGERHSQSAIAKAIAAKLEITFANAFYYVSRVFSK